MATGKKKQFNIVDEIVRDGVGGAPEGGGSNIVIVNVTSAGDPDKPWLDKADKTMDEIVAAWESGAAVFARYSNSSQVVGANIMLPLAVIGDEAVVFATVELGSQWSDTGAYIVRVIIDATGYAQQYYNVFTVNTPT